MKRIAAIVLLLFAAYPTQAKPRWVSSKRFWIGLAVVSAASFADGYTTQRCLAGRTCVEDNPLLSKHPSSVRLYSEGAAVDFSLAYAAWRLNYKAGWTLIGAFSAIEISNAAMPPPKPTKPRGGAAGLELH